MEVTGCTWSIDLIHIYLGHFRQPEEKTALKKHTACKSTQQ